jgi:hypothetical protein
MQLAWATRVTCTNCVVDTPDIYVNTKFWDIEVEYHVTCSTITCIVTAKALQHIIDLMSKCCIFNLPNLLITESCKRTKNLRVRMKTRWMSLVPFGNRKHKTHCWLMTVTGVVLTLMDKNMDRSQLNAKHVHSYIDAQRPIITSALQCPLLHDLLLNAVPHPAERRVSFAVLWPMSTPCSDIFRSALYRKVFCSIIIQVWNVIFFFLQSYWTNHLCM